MALTAYTISSLLRKQYGIYGFEDGKGYISRDSLTTMLGDGDVDELLEEVDPNSTGKVCLGGKGLQFPTTITYY